MRTEYIYIKTQVLDKIRGKYKETNLQVIPVTLKKIKRKKKEKSNLCLEW